MSSEFCDPSRSEAAVRSRLLPGEQLDPPAPLPALFSCSYKGAPSTGVVFPNGFVAIVPHRCSYEAGPCMWDSLRAVESDPEITDVVWDLCVTRLVD